MNQRDIFVEMKKEDRSFGEKVKAPRQMFNKKKEKYRTDFKRFKSQDFQQMADDCDYDYE